MPKYRRKPSTVEATQIHKDMAILGPGDPPEIVDKGFAGNWLITPESGQQYFMTEDVFNEEFEPVKRVRKEKE